MRWTVLNAFGAAAWVAGVVCAKGASGPAAPLLPSSDHDLLIGAAIGAMGLVVLLWANLRGAS